VRLGEQFESVDDLGRFVNFGQIEHSSSGVKLGIREMACIEK
jgi:hypothetical protein